MAQTEVHLKNTGTHLFAQPAELTAICQDGEGLLILDAADLIVRVRFTQKETRDIILKFLPPIP